MNKKMLALIVLLLGLVSFTEAQDDMKIRIKGVVLNEKTKEPVSFANIGLLGTVAGVASDIDGCFELVVPNTYATHMLRFSAVGFSTRDIKLYELMDKGEVEIFLQPVTYGIQSVEITAESLIYIKLLKRALASIGINYIPRPYNYEGYFEYGVRVNDGEEKTKEAIVTIYDKEGYKRSNPETAFRALNYNFSQIRRNHTGNSVGDGLIYFDDIISADIVRNTRNILDLEYIHDFKLFNKGRILYEGDTVQIIGYTCKKPNLSNSGSAFVSGYEGEIYINVENAAIIKNVTRLTMTHFNVMGRNLLIAEKADEKSVKMTISTNYKRVTSYYFLSGISMVYSYQQGAEQIKGEMQYQTTKVRVKNLKPIEGRVYFEDIPMDHAFWDRYTIYLEEED